jgi:hypothetical protein
MMNVGGDHHNPAHASAFAAFASPPLSYDRRNLDEQRQILRDRYAGMGVSSGQRQRRWQLNRWWMLR